MGAGVFKSVEEGCDKLIRVAKTQPPVAEHVAKYDACYRMYTHLYPALKDCYQELAQL